VCLVSVFLATVNYVICFAVILFSRNTCNFTAYVFSICDIMYSCFMIVASTMQITYVYKYFSYLANQNSFYEMFFVLQLFEAASIYFFIFMY
jgi:hypothetical protein